MIKSREIELLKHKWSDEYGDFFWETPQDLRIIASHMLQDGYETESDMLINLADELDARIPD